MAKQIKTRYTDFCENHLYDDFPEANPLPFKYRSKNKVVYYDRDIAVLENVKQTKFGRNGKGFRFLVSSNYEGETDFRLLKNILDHTWCSRRNYLVCKSVLLATTYGCSSVVGLHIFILGRLGVQDQLVIDHIDRLPFNNSISNFRVVSQGINVKNNPNISEEHPYIYGDKDRFILRLPIFRREKRAIFPCLDEAMLYFDALVLKHNLNYPLYINRFYGSFYSAGFLNSKNISSQGDILSVVDLKENKPLTSKYQNICWLEERKAWRLQIRFKNKWVLSRLYKTEQDALEFRENFFLQHPEYINKLTKCYSPELQQLKDSLFSKTKED